MILAVARYARDPSKNPQPPDLARAFQVEEWGALPEPGGLRDQIAGEIDRMTVCRNVYRAVRGFGTAQNKAEWLKMNPDLWRIYLTVEEMERG